MYHARLVAASGLRSRLLYLRPEPDTYRTLVDLAYYDGVDVRAEAMLLLAKAIRREMKRRDKDGRDE